ncbi:MAG TPA: two-component system sensor histidine kinase CreC [Thermodesulfovibrionales bacterium]|nr:two-component system sensor histidine kinase CreC [Thermodesulfovibrionales bacterium]
MKIHTRIILGVLMVVGLGFYLLLSWTVNDLRPQYRKITEEPLVDASRVLASVAAATSKNGVVDVQQFHRIFKDVHAHSFSALVFDYTKTSVDFRVYITDVLGKVIFDSDHGRDEGMDYSQWMDVRRTLRGEYGARTSRDIPGNPGLSMMYVASPIELKGRIVGVLSVGKPTWTANQFFEDSKRKIVVSGTIIFLVVILVGTVLSGMITRPLRRLAAYARAVRDGKRVFLPPLGRSEIRELGSAFEEMRTALEGKHYVERYIQTLTHEIKSPVAAIQGAAELLKEDMPPDQRDLFVSNIRNESERIGIVIEKLLLLSSLENRKGIDDIERLDLREIVEEVFQSTLPMLKAKDLHFEIIGEDGCSLEGDRFLVRQAVINLVQNAVDFSPLKGKVTAQLLKDNSGNIVITIRDHGPGIPDYALDKIFDRFYSLKRPDSGKKSSGLGLSLVKEVALLHKGSVNLNNAHDGGAIATLSFPSRHN